MTDILPQFDESRSLLSTSTSIEGWSSTLIITCKNANSADLGDGRVSISIRHKKRPFGLFRSKPKASTLSDLTEAIPLVESESDLESVVGQPTPPRLNVVI